MAEKLGKYIIISTIVFWQKKKEPPPPKKATFNQLTAATYAGLPMTDLYILYVLYLYLSEQKNINVQWILFPNL